MSFARFCINSILSVCTLFDILTHDNRHPAFLISPTPSQDIRTCLKAMTSYVFVSHPLFGTRAMRMGGY